MSIQLKEPSRSEQIEISYDDLLQKIIIGELGPSLLIKSHILTGNTWLTLDNLKIFHRYSPRVEPFGSLLTARVEQEERKRIRFKNRRDFNVALRSGLIYDKFLGVKPVTNLCNEQSILGVSRLIVYPSFDPTKFYTLKYYRDHIEINALTTRVNFRSLFPEEYQFGYSFGYDMDTLHEDDVVKREGSIKWRQAPGKWSKWRSLFKFSLEVDCCHSHALGGIGYHFEISNGEMMHKAVWSNPSGHRHRPQLKIVDWHIQCAEIAGLGEIWNHSPGRATYRERLELMFQEWLQEMHPDVYDMIISSGGFSKTTLEQDEQVDELRNRWLQSR
jgi:hypothetical protein